MPNDSFRARQLGVSLTVKDLARSFDWYTKILGFTKARDFVRDGVVTGYALNAGDVEVSINQDDGKKGKDRALGQGFSMRIVTDQSIDELAARAKAAGGKLEQEPADMPWGSRIFIAVDPDGYRFVVSSPRNPAAATR
jgi:PhnB protein